MRVTASLSLSSGGGGSRGALSCTISCVNIRKFLARADFSP